MVNMLQQLFIWDFCPFCTRVRVAFDLVGMSYDKVTVAMDDEVVCKALINKRQVPILGPAPGGLVDHPLADTAGILEKLDQYLEKTAPERRFKKSTLPDEARDAFNNIWPAYNMLTIPRLPHLPGAMLWEHRQENLPEWMEKHGFSKDELNAAMDGTEGYKKEIDDIFNVIERHVKSPQSLDGHGLTLDDVNIWSVARQLTSVRGLTLPPKMQAWFNNIRARVTVATFENAAI